MMLRLILCLVMFVFVPLSASAQTKDACIANFRACKVSGAGGSPNPFVETSCDQANITGRLDPSTYKKCVEWCENQKQKCLEKLEEKSEEKSTESK